MASAYSMHSSQQQTHYPVTSYTGGYASTGGTEVITGQRMTTGQERIQSTRKISSTIINEQYLGPKPQDFPTREIEVPGQEIQEIKYVTRKEVREVEKKVPKYEYEWVERIVEVPRYEYVNREVEKLQYVDVPREVKITQWVDLPKEVIREVKVPQIVYVEKIVEVPGEIVEVPKPYVVEQPVQVIRYQDRQAPLVVAQTIKPYIVEGAGTYDVDVYEYEPECVPVDVHVIKPVSAQIAAGGIVETMHRVIAVPAAQYNSMLQQLNVHLSQAEVSKLPYQTGVGGTVQFLSERIQYTQPQVGVQIIGYTERGTVTTTQAVSQHHQQYVGSQSAVHGGQMQHVLSGGQMQHVVGTGGMQQHMMHGSSIMPSSGSMMSRPAAASNTQQTTTTTTYSQGNYRPTTMMGSTPTYAQGRVAA